jgi:hypothetical protein
MPTVAHLVKDLVKNRRLNCRDAKIYGVHSTTLTVAVTIQSDAKAT